MGAYTVRPLSDRTWLRPPAQRESTRFSAKWPATEELLLAEVEYLEGSQLVIEVDVREQDLRIDGTLRANGREAVTPAVVVAFESAKHGPMLYRCDTFVAPWSHQGKSWWHNVRAIALTLQALRSVDRYGATETGQQYAGFKALPAGRAMPSSHMTRTDAEELLWTVSGLGRDKAWPLEGRWKKARSMSHPDRHDGDRTLWDQVEQAASVLGLSS
jgi:hypothetical protein